MGSNADYICCDDCDRRLYYDGGWQIRDEMERQGGTVYFFCKDCGAKLAATGNNENVTD